MTEPATQEIACIPVDTEIAPQDQSNLYCLLFGRGDFRPTGNMCRLVVAFMADEENLSPRQMLMKQGHAAWNWYKWQKEYPGFLSWWNTVIEDTIKDEHLSRLYLALFKRGLTHDTGAAKLIAQRYDPKYTERSQQDQRLAFAGYEPGMVEDSKERMRLAVAEEKQGTHKALPVAEQGPAHSLPVPDQAQAQTPSQGHVAGMDAVLDNDNTLDSEPISKVSTPGGGFDE